MHAIGSLSCTSRIFTESELYLISLGRRVRVSPGHVLNFGVNFLLAQALSGFLKT